MKSFRKILLSVVVSAAMVVGLTGCGEKEKAKQIKSDEVVQKLTNSMAAINPSTGISISGNQSTKFGAIAEDSDFRVDMKTNQTGDIEAVYVKTEMLPGFDMEAYSDYTASYVNLDGFKYASMPLLKPETSPQSAVDPSSSEEVEPTQPDFESLFSFYKVNETSYYVVAENDGLTSINLMIAGYLNNLQLNFLKVTLNNFRVDLKFTKQNVISSFKLDAAGKVEANQKAADIVLKADINLKDKVSIAAPADKTSYLPANKIMETVLAEPITTTITLDVKSVLPTATPAPQAAAGESETSNVFEGKTEIEIKVELESIPVSATESMKSPKISITFTEDTLQLGTLISSMISLGTPVKSIVFGMYVDTTNPQNSGIALVIRDASDKVLLHMSLEEIVTFLETFAPSDGSTSDSSGESEEETPETPEEKAARIMLIANVITSVLFPTSATIEDGKIALSIETGTLLSQLLTGAFASLSNMMIDNLGGSLAVKIPDSTPLESYDYAAFKALTQQLASIPMVANVDKLGDFFASLPLIGFTGASINFEYTDGVQFGVALTGTNGYIKLNVESDCPLNKLMALAMVSGSTVSIA